MNSVPSCSCGYLLGLCLEGGRQHVGEELQRHRKQELHEGHNDEHQEGEKSEDVGTSSQELGRKKTQFKSRVACGMAAVWTSLQQRAAATWSSFVSLVTITLLTEPTLSTLHRESIHLHGNRKHPVHRRVIPYTHSTEASYSYILQKHSIAKFYSAV